MIKVQNGRVTNREFRKNKDGIKKVTLLQVEVTDPDDIQTIELVSPFGEESNPTNDSQVIIVPISEAYKVAVAVDDGIEPSMGIGEKKIYSVTDTTIAAFMNWKANGNVEIQGNDDFAVRFDELKIAFDELVTDFNDHISKYNNHIHPDPVSGNTGTPTVTDSPTSADVELAKVDNVLLPGAS